MKLKQIPAVLLSVILLLTGAMGTAVAHTFSDRTRLTFNVSDRTVREGDTVVFRGRLIARHKVCRANQTVSLYRNGVLVDQTTTDERGFYRFTREVTRDGTYRVRFEGSVSGTHTHSHKCRPSKSRRITIEVRNGGGQRFFDVTSSLAAVAPARVAAL
jgi:hypothetical protein